MAYTDQTYGYQNVSYDPSKSNTLFDTTNPFGKMTQDSYYTQYPSAGYSQWLNQQNLGGYSNASQYAQSQQTRYYNGYLSYLPYMDPNQNQFLDFLNISGANPYGEYQSQGARDRGEQPFMYEPRTRWTLPT